LNTDLQLAHVQRALLSLGIRRSGGQTEAEVLLVDGVDDGGERVVDRLHQRLHGRLHQLRQLLARVRHVVDDLRRVTLSSHLLCYQCAQFVQRIHYGHVAALSWRRSVDNLTRVAIRRQQLLTLDGEQLDRLGDVHTDVGAQMLVEQRHIQFAGDNFAHLKRCENIWQEI
jgi:hypothetical protein